MEPNHAANSREWTGIERIRKHHRDHGNVGRWSFFAGVFIIIFNLYNREGITMLSHPSGDFYGKCKCRFKRLASHLLRLSKAEEADPSGQV